MKKIIAILLSLALLLGCAAGLAEGAEKQSFGTIRVNGEFTLKGSLPEGYKVQWTGMSFQQRLNEQAVDVFGLFVIETYSFVGRDERRKVFIASPKSCCMCSSQKRGGHSLHGCKIYIHQTAPRLFNSL